MHVFKSLMLYRFVIYHLIKHCLWLFLHKVGHQFLGQEYNTLLLHYYFSKSYFICISPLQYFPINIIRSEVFGIICFSYCVFRGMWKRLDWGQEISRLTKWCWNYDKMIGDCDMRHLLLTTITTTPSPPAPTITSILYTRGSGFCFLLFCLRVRDIPLPLQVISHLFSISSPNYCMFGSLDLASAFTLNHWFHDFWAKVTIAVRILLNFICEKIFEHMLE